jgi:cell division protein FtsQ
VTAVIRLAEGLARRKLLVTAAALALACGTWGLYMWGRDRSIFEVEHVTIVGVSGKQAPDIRRALRAEARRMTTLHVEQRDLASAVSSFQSVRSVSAEADFPHSLRIEVSEWRPVAVVVGPDRRRVAVSSVGTLLSGVGPDAKLPTVVAAAVPTTGTLGDVHARALVRVLGGAPAPLRPLLDKAFLAGGVARVATRSGISIYFGEPTRLAAKWAAAARVLADPDARGADVIDVRTPARPAARNDPQAAAAAGDQAAAASASTTAQP